MRVAVAAVPGLPPEAMCAAETARYERLYGIPPQLLDAISIVESGRWDAARRATLAWPWTITADGEGKFFPTKAEALAEVRRLKSRGVTNIDIGCMQVNLRYHPEAFSSIEDAFDPAANVAYAARFLKGLYGATGVWQTAASYYHSQTPHLAAAYKAKLMKVWSGAGASARSALASVQPVPHAPQLKPVPPSSQRVEEMRQAWRDQTAGNRDEARRIADAYRRARLAEYQLRRARMVDARRAAGLSSDGY
ncbi:MAG: transglycosylase SLT domain-containing protein [Magnetospirillum sp.]|nr:transglycosylase SLT domain-containing protein [Magnetospirillum sp.]